MKNRYVVWAEKNGCPKCHHGGRYWVLDVVEDMCGSTGYGSREEAQEVCLLQNRAFRLGFSEAKKSSKKPK